MERGAWLGITLLLILALRQVGSATEEGFQPITQARIESRSGVAQLIINGKPVPPVIFWFNVGQASDYLERFQNPQVRLAAAAGIHIYGLLIYFPRAADGISIDFGGAEQILDTFIEVDPEAVFFLRAVPWPTPQWADWKEVPKDEFMIFDDGTTAAPYISIASDYFARSFEEETTRIVSHFETSPYAGRMLGYHLGGPEFEMFPPHYTDKGPDYCEASQRLFRKWLREKYKTSKALREAWGDETVSLAGATIPRPEKGRFPMVSVSDGSPIKVFYDRPAEQAWVDYSDYYSDLVASRVMDWARTVKQASGGRRLSMFCQGYMLEIGGSFSGHYALDKVLSCPEIDVLMSPVSYAARQVGEPAGFMAPVDSVNARGKLWLSEDDMRTAYIDKEAVPAWFPPTNVPQPYDTLATPQATRTMLERNLAAAFAHRAGIWWCDLMGAGAFNEPNLWRMLKERMKLYEDLYAHPRPYRPEVAFLLAERSRFGIRSDWDMNTWSLGQLRNECDLSGVSVGYYLLEDFISGVVPRCKVYLFANAFELSEEQIAGIRARLEREGATAIWNYAAGYLGPQGPDATRMKALTGLEIATDDGTQVSEGIGPLAGETLGASCAWSGQPMNFSPRFTVRDPAAEPLSVYKSDGAVASAQKQVGRIRSVYLGGVGLTAPVLRRLFVEAGAHSWTDDGSVVVTDGSFLMIHSAKAGLKAIKLPKGVTATALGGQIERWEGSQIYAHFGAGDTRWFSLGR